MNNLIRGKHPLHLDISMESFEFGWKDFVHKPMDYVTDKFPDSPGGWRLAVAAMLHSDTVSELLERGCDWYPIGEEGHYGLKYKGLALVVRRKHDLGESFSHDSRTCMRGGCQLCAHEENIRYAHDKREYSVHTKVGINHSYLPGLEVQKHSIEWFSIEEPTEDIVDPETDAVLAPYMEKVAKIQDADK